MASWNLTLSGNGTDQKTHSYAPSIGYTIRILRDNENKWSFVHGEWINPPFESSLGQIAIYNGCVVLESHVQGCSIEPWQPSDVSVNEPYQAPWAIKLPRSGKKNRKAVFLRPGDAVNFLQDNVKITVGFKPAIKDETLVEVKSSEPVKKEDNIFGTDGAADSDTDDDDDLDLKPSVNQSMSTGPSFVQQSVQSEVVNNLRSPSTPGEPFSTARTAPQIIQETPTIKRDRNKNIRFGDIKDQVDEDEDPLNGSRTNVQLNGSPVAKQTVLEAPTPDAFLPVEPQQANDGDIEMDESTHATAVEDLEGGDQSEKHITTEGGLPAAVEVEETKPTGDEELPEVSEVMSSAERKRKASETLRDSEEPDATPVSATSKRLKASQGSVSSSKSFKRLKAKAAASPSPSITASPLPATADTKSDQYTGPAPRILFSNTEVNNIPAIMRFLKDQHATPSTSLTKSGSNFLCVGQGELKTTAKLLISLVMDKEIITDSWATASQKANYLLSTAPFLPESLSATKSLDRTALFGGKTIVFTPALKKAYGSGFGDIQTILKHAGAKESVSRPARDVTETEDVVVIGLESGDNDARALLARGVAVYKKDLVSASILEAKLKTGDADLRISPKSGRKGR